MRNVVASLFVSLDGVAESPDQWQFEFDDDMLATITAEVAGVDTILLGRVTYEEWLHYWPTSMDEPFASHINSTPKVVVSTTLDKVEWGQWDRISLIKANLAEAITRLKQQPGKDIGTVGSPTLVRSLLQSDLLDTLRLWVHPVVAGSGKRLFKDGDDLKRLKLVDSKVTPSGCVILTYELVKRS
ncbi:MAG: dihydrofolate reductase family protein [Chloroflexi bacterium]|nr:dihydrofolate reductase family protein [Chloroflexota bacterium]